VGDGNLGPRGLVAISFMQDDNRAGGLGLAAGSLESDNARSLLAFARVNNLLNLGETALEHLLL
jgi:hypothetical protein